MPSRNLCFIFLIFTVFTYLNCKSQEITCQQIYYPEKDADVWYINSQTTSWGATNDSNYGSNDRLEPQEWTWSGSWGIIRSFIDFGHNSSTLSSSTTVNSAIISLSNPFESNTNFSHLYYGSWDNEGIIYLVNENWGETNITWNNQPLISTANSIVMPAVPNIEGQHSYEDITIDISSLLINSGMLINSPYGICLRMQNGENITNHYRRQTFASKEYADQNYWPRLDISYTFPEPNVTYDESGIFTVSNIEDINTVYDNIEFEWEIQGMSFTGNPVNYSWDCQIPDSTFSVTMRIFNNLGNECQYTHDSTLHIVPPVTLQSNADFCENEPTTLLEASPSGGDWSGNGIVSSDGQFNPQIAGVGEHTINYYISECGGISTDFTISVHPQPETEITNTVNPSCFGDADGSITLQCTNLSTVYYTWSNGDNTETITNLEAGNYTVTITSQYGCQTHLGPIELINPPELSMSTDLIIQPSCYGGNNGQIQVNASGGTISSDYSYLWNNGFTDNEITQLTAGNYTLTVSDDNGCTNNISIELEQPNPIGIDIFVDSVYCNFGESGYIYAIATGDNPPFSYVWTDGTNNDSIEINGEGYYYVTVTDNSGCFNTDSIQILIPEFPYNLNIETENITCYGLNNGSITTFPSGGFPPYDLTWHAPGNNILYGSNLTMLESGVYYLNAVDSMGCEIETHVLISEPSPLQNMISNENPTCIGAENGEIILETLGGTPPYHYQINDIQSNFSEFTNLAEGNYTIHTFDSLGCEIVQTLSLIDNPTECIRIPNAFTPNSDDTNDTWVIENIEMFEGWSIKVFNRWGQLIYVGTTIENFWDGRTPNGSLVPTGSYIYIIEGIQLPENYCGIVSVVY